MTRRFPLALALAAGVLLLHATTSAQDFDAVRIETVPVADGLYMLTGQGGNIGVSVGDDGVFMIDDQYAPLSDKILAAVRALSDKPIEFLINTHWHGDHTGGNEAFGKGGSIIVAHDNVRQRLSTEQFVAAFNMKSPPQSKAALPVITFGEAVTFHLNGNEIEVFHVPAAHTDGDSIVHFKTANVIHGGDICFNGFYPFIDASSGGTVDGMIAGVDAVLARANDDTRIIPGHGALADKAALRAYRDMLATMAQRMRELKAAGKTREEAIAAKPTSDLDAKWGNGFLKPDVWVGILYDATP